jgi:anti-sigma factor RsiW
MHGPVPRLNFRRDHRWAPARMSEYLDGELPARPRGRLEHHLDECRECRRLLEGLRQVIEGLQRLPSAAGGGDGARITMSVRLRLGEPPRS